MKRGSEVLRRARLPALALLTAFALGAVVIVLTDYEHLRHFGTDPLAAIGGAIGGVVQGYGAMLAGAIGDPIRIVTAIQTGDPRDIADAIRPVTEALLSATPFIFASLGVAIAFHAGLINLGVAGQFLMGGLGATATAVLLGGHLPSALVLVLALAGGTLAGAAYGFVPGILKARTGAHEVITTLMLNSIAPEIAILTSATGVLSGSLTSIAQVPLVFDLPAVRLDWGFAAAILVAAAVSFLLFRTTLGFELRSVGHNRTAARTAGIRTGLSVTLALTLSGGLAGMGGAFLTMGPAGRMSLPSGDIGLVALALALIAGLRPGGVVLAALLYGALTNGAKTMGIATGIPLALLVVIIAFAMMFVAAPGLIRSIWRIKEPASETDPASFKPTGLADST